MRFPAPFALAALLAMATSARAGDDGGAPGDAVDAGLSAAVAKVVAQTDPGKRAAAAAALVADAGPSAETLAGVLRRLPAADAPPPGEHALALPSWDGTRVVELDVVLVVPPKHDPSKPAPLLFAHHGAGGRGADMVPLWRNICAGLGAILVCPDGLNSEGYAFESAERSALMEVLREVRRRILVDDDRIWITGVSRGGHVTWDLCLRHPGVFAAAAPMIGGPRLSNTKGENNLRYLENLVPLPLRDLQGTQDDRYLLDNLRSAFASLAKWKAPDAKLIEFPDRGHDFDMAAVVWTEWLGAARRDPAAATVVRRAARDGEGRHLWLEVTRTTSPAEEIFTPRVDGAKWARMDADQRRDWMAAEIDRRTARAEARRTAPGAYAVTSTGVKGFRLLLDAAALPEDGAVTVTWNGRANRRTAKPDAALLLEEFARSMDRAFLPVAVVSVP